MGDKRAANLDATIHVPGGPVKEDPTPVPDAPPPLEHVSALRIALPQVLASTAKNMLLLDLGMTVAFSTIVIPALREGNDPKGLSFTPEEASWFGSILFLCQPLGSVLSGFILEPLGRKYAMMVVNLPHLLGWFLLYTAANKLTLYSAAMIMGLGVGFMEAPIITYVGEISQPRLRGTLTSYANLFATFGMNFIYILGTLVTWRVAAAISIAVPIVTIIAISQVPETPVWLMSRGRHKDAENALCWLRGWVSPEHVKKEFDELSRYTEATKLRKTNGVVNPAFTGDDGTVVQQPEKEFEELTMKEKIKDFVRPSMLKPLGLIVGYFFFSNFTGITATRPYMVLIARDYNMPLEAYKATVVFGTVGFAGSVLCMLTVAKFKKRPIALSSMIIAAISASFLCFFSHPWVSFFSYMALAFSSSYGAQGLVWALVSEVFPFRGRSMASGLSAASSYLISFTATKSFQSLEELLGLRGLFMFYSVITFIGFFFLYFIMPETEGRPLEDIEKDYEKNKSKPNDKVKLDNVV
nr:facilitated trehalose transporter Tret1-like [Halyomorpha halys]